MIIGVAAKRRLRMRLVIAILSLVGQGVFLAESQAEKIIGLTFDNQLISFDSASPGVVTSIGPVAGIAAGDLLIGIDRRPQALNGIAGPDNGRTYAVGRNAVDNTSRVYSINETNGLATLRATLAADPSDATFPTFSSMNFLSVMGIDFDPSIDRLRVTAGGQNLLINVDDGFVRQDPFLTYPVGDVRFGASPTTAGIAYSNNFGGATSSSLFGIASWPTPASQIAFTDVDAGAIETVGDLPFGIDSAAGYDISGITGTHYMAIGAVRATNTSFYKSDVNGWTLVGNIGSGIYLRGIAAPVGAPVPEPTMSVLCTTILGALNSVLWRRRPGDK